MNDNELDNPTVGANGVAKLQTIVPKFCTDIHMGLLNNRRNVVMSMIFNENDGVNSHNVLIDRIIVDIDLIISMKDTLEQIIKDAKNEK